MDLIQTIDWSCLQWIHTHLQCSFLNTVMPIITRLGDVGAIWLIIAAVLLFIKKYRKCGIMIIIGIASGFVVGNLCLKPMIARPRPCWLDSTVQLLIPMETDYSFPSGHTLASVIAATILTLNNKTFGFAAIPLAVLIAFSRLYLYLHFLTDVLASVCLGISIALLIYWWINKVYPMVHGKVSKDARCL